MKKLRDKDGTELFEYTVEVTCSPKRIEYIAESEEECKQLFLEANPDLDERDIEILPLENKLTCEGCNKVVKNLNPCENCGFRNLGFVNDNKAVKEVKGE